MDAKKVGNWVQTVSGIALIVGIALVVMEMRQSKQLTRAQMAAESWGFGLSRTLAFLGENPMEAMAKACDPDAVLTREDALVLSYIFSALYSTIGRAWEVSEIAKFDDERWKGVARSNFPLIFSTQHGRAWWTVVRSSRLGTLGTVRAYGDEILAAQGPPVCYALTDAILEADRNKLVEG